MKGYETPEFWILIATALIVYALICYLFDMCNKRKAVEQRKKLDLTRERENERNWNTDMGS